MQQYVLRFDISVDNIVVVHELHSVADLPEISLDPVLWESGLFLQAGV